jgi:hypothetical protein
MERFTNDCIEMIKNSKAEEDRLLGLDKREVTAQEIQQSLKISLQRLRNCIEFTLLMRRRVARLALEVAKSTSNYDLHSGEAMLVAELDKCTKHNPILPLEDILADLNKRLQKQDNS